MLIEDVEDFNNFIENVSKTNLKSGTKDTFTFNNTDYKVSIVGNNKISVKNLKTNNNFSLYSDINKDDTNKLRNLISESVPLNKRNIKGPSRRSLTMSIDDFDGICDAIKNETPKITDKGSTYKYTVNGDTITIFDDGSRFSIWSENFGNRLFSNKSPVYNKFREQVKLPVTEPVSSDAKASQSSKAKNANKIINNNNTTTTTTKPVTSNIPTNIPKNGYSTYEKTLEAITNNIKNNPENAKNWKVIEFKDGPIRIETSDGKLVYEAVTTSDVNKFYNDYRNNQFGDCEYAIRVNDNFSSNASTKEEREKVNSKVKVDDSLINKSLDRKPLPTEKELAEKNKQNELKEEITKNNKPSVKSTPPPKVENNLGDAMKKAADTKNGGKTLQETLYPKNNNTEKPSEAENIYKQTSKMQKKQKAINNSVIPEKGKNANLAKKTTLKPENKPKVNNKLSYELFFDNNGNPKLNYSYDVKTGKYNGTTKDIDSIESRVLKEEVEQAKKDLAEFKKRITGERVVFNSNGEPTLFRNGVDVTNSYNIQELASGVKGNRPDDVHRMRDAYEKALKNSPYNTGGTPKSEPEPEPELKPDNDKLNNPENKGPELKVENEGEPNPKPNPEKPGNDGKGEGETFTFEDDNKNEGEGKDNIGNKGQGKGTTQYEFRYNNGKLEFKNGTTWQEYKESNSFQLDSEKSKIVDEQAKEFVKNNNYSGLTRDSIKDIINKQLTDKSFVKGQATVDLPNGEKMTVTLDKTNRVLNCNINGKPVNFSYNASEVEEKVYKGINKPFGERLVEGAKKLGEKLGLSGNKEHDAFNDVPDENVNEGLAQTDKTGTAFRNNEKLNKAYGKWERYYGGEGFTGENFKPGLSGFGEAFSQAAKESLYKGPKRLLTDSAKIIYHSGMAGLNGLGFRGPQALNHLKAMGPSAANIAKGVGTGFLIGAGSHLLRDSVSDDILDMNNDVTNGNLGYWNTAKAITSLGLDAVNDAFGFLISPFVNAGVNNYYQGGLARNGLTGDNGLFNTMHALGFAHAYDNFGTNGGVDNFHAKVRRFVHDFYHDDKLKNYSPQQKLALMEQAIDQHRIPEFLYAEKDAKALLKPVLIDVVSSDKNIKIGERIGEDLKRKNKEKLDALVKTLKEKKAKASATSTTPATPTTPEVVTPNNNDDDNLIKKYKESLGLSNQVNQQQINPGGLVNRQTTRFVLPPRTQGNDSGYNRIMNKLDTILNR